MDTARNKILICADTTDVNALAAILGGEYVVYAPENGEDAYFAAKAFNPGVIMLDTAKPEYFDAAAIFAHSAEFGGLPLIAVLPPTESGNEALLPPDINGYITRPFIAAAVKFTLREKAEAGANLIQYNLERNQRMLYALSNAAVLLLDSDAHNFDGVLQQSLKIIAESVSVDRMFIWRNHKEGGVMRCTKLYEWVNSEELSDGIKIGDSIPYDNITSWTSALSRGKGINKKIIDLPEEERAFLQKSKVVSFLVEPMTLNGNFWGFVGFDDCRAERKFTRGEESILRSSSMMITNAFARYETMKELRKTSEMLIHREKIMDTLNQSSVQIVSRAEATFEDTMTAGINPIAEIADVDRISVWRNFESVGMLYAEQIYRWDKESGGTTEPDKRFAAMAYRKAAPFLIKLFYDGNNLNSIVKNLPNPKIFAQYGIVSVFAAPVYIRGNLWGFVMFEDRREERLFTGDLVYLMRYASFLIANAIIRDKTEREVMEAEERIKLMLDSTPLCCQLWDEALNIIDCNEEAIKLFGLANKNEYIRRYYDLSPAYQSGGRRSFETLAGFLSKAFESGEVIFEWTHCKPDGTVIPAEITLKRVKYSGSFIVAGYTRDLRIQKKMLADIETRDKLLRTINNAALVLLHSNTTSFEDDIVRSMEMIADVLDIGCVYIWKNYLHNGQLHCFELYGWQDEGSPDSEISTFCYDEHVPGWRETFMQGDCINGPANGMSRKAQDYMQECGALSVFITPLFIEEQFWGFVGYDDHKRERVFSEEDISILHSGNLLLLNSILRNEMLVSLHDSSAQLEFALLDANKASRAKSVFLANMSHEIRTPMNSIIGLSELAAMEEVPPKVKNYLDAIAENSELLLHIINDILDLSKIEAGKIALLKSPFDIRNVFSRCRASVGQKAISKGIEFESHAEIIHNKWLLGDSFKLTQALINLLGNAVKFTESGKIGLFSSVIRQDEETAVLRFEIKDTGIGMTDEQLTKIFNPFMQADDTIERKYGGTGLGLTITKSIVELMGGFIHVESVPHKGSRFWFELTFGLVEATALEVKDTSLEYDEFSMPTFKGTVLICEDSKMNQLVICEHLTRVGLDTIVAANGLEGVQLVENRLSSGKPPFDLIFMDIHMPVMNGLEAAATITALGVKTPIVALTANVFPEDIETYQEQGMIGYLGKPFKSKELWQCLMQYMQPVSVTVIAQSQTADDDKELHRKLTYNFVKNNQKTYADIESAIVDNNMELARRLAHTLKSNAGQIGESELQSIAAGIEYSLSGKLSGGDGVPNDEQLYELETAISAVLEKLAPMLTESTASTESLVLNDADVIRLFGKLTVMIESHNPECMNHLRELRTIPGTAELVRLIEQFDFPEANAELERLAQALG